MKEICTINIFMNDEDVYSGNVVVDRHTTPISELPTRTIMEILAGLTNKGGILDEIKKRKKDDNSPVIEMFIGLEFGKVISDLVELAKIDDGEIDKWVEEHVVVPPDDELSEAKRPIYADIVPPIIEWGKNIAHKFYELGKKHNQLNKL